MSIVITLFTRKLLSTAADEDASLESARNQVIMYIGTYPYFPSLEPCSHPAPPTLSQVCCQLDSWREEQRNDLVTVLMQGTARAKRREEREGATLCLCRRVHTGSTCNEGVRRTARLWLSGPLSLIGDTARAGRTLSRIEGCTVGGGE